MKKMKKQPSCYFLST